MNRIIIRAAGLACLLSGLAVSLAVAGSGKQGVRHQYPVAGAAYVSPKTNIGICAWSAIDRASLGEGSYSLVGSRSGVHAASVKLSVDRTCAIFHPLTPFACDEFVSVTVHLRLIGGGEITDAFTFTTERYKLTGMPTSLEMELGNHPQGSAGTPMNTEGLIPPLKVWIDSGATQGTIYCSTFAFPKQYDSSYLLNLNEHGVIARAQMLHGTSGMDFRMQPSGVITCFDRTANKFYALNSAWMAVDSFEGVNGFDADQHELCLLPDGGYAFIGVRWGPVDMSQYFPGGDTAAGVMSNAIQVFDREHNEVFEWRGLDHYNIVDAVHEKMLAHVVDFEHANSLEVDSLGNLLFSNRHLSEITKIDGKTGDIMWRLGGVHNQFTLLDDSIWFSYQHSARELSNGHLLFFDNADYDSVMAKPGLLNHSRALEYDLDTVKKTARLVWEFHHTPETYSFAMGNVQRFRNGNTLIGWGANEELSVTEVQPDKRTVFELTLGNKNVSYRAFKDVDGERPLKGVATERSPAPIETGSTISYTLDAPQLVTFGVYDLLGRRLSTATTFESAGQHDRTPDLRELSSGTYYGVVRTHDGMNVRAVHVTR
jgi:hypothetical protein